MIFQISPQKPTKDKTNKENTLNTEKVFQTSPQKKNSNNETSKENASSPFKNLKSKRIGERTVQILRRGINKFFFLLNHYLCNVNWMNLYLYIKTLQQPLRICLLYSPVRFIIKVHDRLIQVHVKQLHKTILVFFTRRYKRYHSKTFRKWMAPNFN